MSYRNQTFYQLNYFRVYPKYTKFRAFLAIAI